VKDIDFGYHQITVREGKGMKDRVTMLPTVTEEYLRSHLEKIRILHDQDLAEEFGEVWLPYALERKYPNANREWAWQYVFPSFKRSADPRSGKIRRHHVDEKTLRRAVKKAVMTAKIHKNGSCHSFAPICWKQDMISGLYRNFWGTKMSAQP